MRVLPRSLFGRLLGIAALATLAALLFAGFSIGHVLERFVMQGLDDRLDAQVVVLARAVRPDGTLDLRQAIDLPHFDEPGSGWEWQVAGAKGRWSNSPDVSLDVRPLPPPDDVPARHGPASHEPRPGESIGRSGERLHVRQLKVATAAGPVTIIAGGPRRIVQSPLREAMIPLLMSLLLLGSGLAFATWLQLRVGLRPLRKLGAELAQVRAGAQRHIGVDQPSELLPLATELNALIDQNEAGLAHARGHLSNLAHGLKTPLAALSVKLSEPGRDPDDSLGDMVRRIDGHIRHHLGRARAAAPGGGGRARTLLAPAVEDLAGVMQGIHAERPIAVSMSVAADLAVAVDPRDLDEMIGNLLDNAWRHAATSIRIEAIDSSAYVELLIDDDGPGLSYEAICEAMVAGRRLDERGDGHGFGLSICRELAELNAGSVELLRSPVTCGLRARLILP